MKRRYCLILCSLILTGCYRNWPQLDALVNQVDCTTSKSQAVTLAQKAGASVEWDPTYKVLSIVKEQDALALQFVPVSFGSQLLRLDSVSAARSTIRYLGLHRQQGEVVTMLRCGSTT
jgi:hypothetical protein